MIASMTGYARAQGSDDRRRWVWEARSVNGRNLEIRCRVPPGFDRLENPARVAVGGKMKRGNVSLTLTITSERNAKPLTINRTLLAELATLVDVVRRTTGAAAGWMYWTRRRAIPCGRSCATDSAGANSRPMPTRPR